MRSALTIAGSDSGAGAGIQADLKTFAAHGVYGTTAITAITAQNTMTVTRVLALSPDIVAAQIDAVADDIRPDAVKTGMLASTGIVQTVADAVERHRLPHLVVDPVMVSKSGRHLLDDDAVEAVRRRLLPLAQVVTPNRPEAEVLVGHPLATLADAHDAARRIAALGAAAVVIKGGHFEEPTLVNLLYDGVDFYEIATPRLESRHTHGTGCTFASSIAAHLALGRSLLDAVDRATQYVAGAIRAGLALGSGHGPVDHFWETSDTGARGGRHRNS
jgi:hydroxymethylpyrimidine/phosphomethylpyrimidine kinase